MFIPPQSRPGASKARTSASARAASAPVRPPWQARSRNPAQRRVSASLAAEPAPVAETANRTGLPDSLKAGVEALSGVSLDDVRTVYGSSKPARLQALAYARGSEIHLGPGQERHLPHEVWHVVQQKQGRVRPTLEAGGVPINADPALEREADAMAERAQAIRTAPTARSPALLPAAPVTASLSSAATAQRVIAVGTKQYQLAAAIEFLTVLAKDTGLTDDAIRTAATLWNEQDFSFHGEMDVLLALQSRTYKSRGLGPNGNLGKLFGRSTAFTDPAEAKTMVTLEGAIDSEAEADKPGYLYRAMTAGEFTNLKTQKKLVPVDNNAYLGLSGNPHYSAGAMTKGDLSHLVEFEFSSKEVHKAVIAAFVAGKIEGTASNQGFDVPKELSTRSIGLGPQGNASADFKKNFNGWIASGAVRWRLLRLIK